MPRDYQILQCDKCYYRAQEIGIISLTPTEHFRLTGILNFAQTAVKESINTNPQIRGNIHRYNVLSLNACNSFIKPAQ